MAFFRKNAFGIDISETSVKAVELKPKNGGAQVVAYTSFSLPEGLIVGGEIKNTEGLVEELRNGFKKNGKNVFSADECLVSLPDSLVYVDIFEFDQSEGGSLAEAVNTHATNRFPIAGEKVVFDWDVVAESEDISDVLIAAMQKDIMQQYYSVFKKAGLQPVLFESHALSTTRGIFSRIEKCEALAPVIVLDLGKSESSLMIYDECAMRLSTIFDITGDALTKEIADAVGEKSAKVEQLKKKHGLSLTLKGKSKKRVLQNIVDDGIVHLETVAKKYENKTGRKIEEVYLAGKTAQLPYLRQYMDKKMQMKVGVVDPLKNVVQSKSAGLIKKDAAITAIGAGFRSFNTKFNQGINLLNK